MIQHKNLLEKPGAEERTEEVFLSNKKIFKKTCASQMFKHKVSLLIAATKKSIL